MHIIRLREPWEVEPRPGGVVYRRYFNRPTGLAGGEAVRLAIDGLPLLAAVSFNGAPLAEGSSGDITAALLPRNLVVIEVAGAEAAGELPFGEVRLEIG